jgi:hypothetical protein
MSTKSESATSTNDNRSSTAWSLAGDQKGVMVGGNLENSNVILSDHGAIQDGLTFAGEAGAGALDFADNAMEDSYTFAGEVAAGSIKALAANNTNNLDFLTEVNQDSLEFAAGALENNTGMANRVFDALDGATDDAYSFIGGAVNSTFDQINKNSQFLAEGFQASHQATVDGSKLAVDSANKSADRVYAAFSTASDKIGSFAGEAFTSLKDMTNNVLNGVAGFTQASQKQLAQQTSAGLEAVAKVNRTESEKTVETITKVALGAGAVITLITVVAIYRGSK